MFQELVNDLGLWGEDVWHETLLLSANQERYELAEITSEDWVEVFLFNIDELEKSIEKYESVLWFFFLIITFSWDSLDCSGFS